MDLVEALNAEPNRECLEQLRMYDEPRVVVAVAVAFGQESSEKLSTQALANLSLTKYSAAPEIRLGGSLADSVTVRLSDGTTFAYDLARMCFTEKAGRIVVAGLDPDRPAADADCPAGTYKSIIALDEAKAASQARGGPH